MERLTEKIDGGYRLKIPKDTELSDLEIKFAAYDKLGAYEDAEEQGLLLWLPCKVGDTVYIVVGKDISPQTITGILISTRVGMEFTTRKRVFNETSIGQTVFLTREEAESALVEKGEQNER